MSTKRFVRITYSRLNKDRAHYTNPFSFSMALAALNWVARVMPLFLLSVAVTSPVDVTDALQLAALASPS